MLKRNIQVRQHFALRHQRDYFIHMGIGVDVMQAHPDTEFAQRAYQFGHARLERLAVPKAGAVFHIHAIGAGVLRDDQQLLHARFG